MRKHYSVRDLDSLRKVITNKYEWGYYDPIWVFEYGMSERNHFSFQNQFERRISVEEEVRTHMIAGHYAADLVRDEKEVLVAYFKSTGYKVDEETHKIIKIENS